MDNNIKEALKTLNEYCDSTRNCNKCDFYLGNLKCMLNNVSPCTYATLIPKEEKKKGKPKLIIVEAPQGGGKTTITNILRDKMTYTNLLRLSGIEDVSSAGCDKVYNLRLGELEYIRKSAWSGINFILDRCHMTEKVYCNLKYKSYDFVSEAETLNKKLGALTEFYDVYFVLLIANKETYGKRLKRDKPQYASVNFDVENSLRQQDEFIKEYGKLGESTDIFMQIINTSYSTPEELASRIIQFTYDFPIKLDARLL